MRKTKIVILLFLYSSLLFSQDVDKPASKDSTKTEKKEKKFPFVAMPTLTYDRSQGGGIGAIAMGLFKADNSKKITLSRIMFVGNYATNGSFYAMLGTRLYLLEDTWRLLAA